MLIYTSQSLCYALLAVASPGDKPCASENYYSLSVSDLKPIRHRAWSIWKCCLHVSRPPPPKMTLAVPSGRTCSNSVTRFVNWLQANASGQWDLDQWREVHVLACVFWFSSISSIYFNYFLHTSKQGEMVDTKVLHPCLFPALQSYSITCTGRCFSGHWTTIDCFGDLTA